MATMPALLVRETMSAIEPPTGVTANPVDTSPIPIDLIVLASICLVLVLAAVVALSFTQVFVARSVQLEDCMCFYSRH